jgi:predicted CXXCH cytochrome family protein
MRWYFVSIERHSGTRDRVGFFMRLDVFIPITLFMLLLASACPAWADAAKPAAGILPDSKKNCTNCHPSYSLKKGAAPLNKPIADLCIGCHGDRKSPSEHKVDIIPPMMVRQLPLSDGKMTCVTCHDPHQNPSGNLLRMTEPELCMLCHNK